MPTRTDETEIEELPPAPRKLQQWCTRALRLVTDDGVAERLELWCERKGEPPVKVTVWTLQEDRAWTPEELAAEVYLAATNHVESQFEGGSLRMVVYAFDRTSRDHQDSHAWIAQARVDHPTQRHESLARVDHQQALGVMVRGLHDAVQTLLVNVGPLLQQSAEQNKILGEQFNQGVAAQLKMAQLLAEAGTQQRRDTITEEIELLKARRSDQWHTLLMGLAPTLVANALPTSNVGKAIAENGKDPLRVSVQKLVESLGPQDIMKVAGMLSPVQQQLFMSIAQIAAQDHAAEDAARPDNLKEQPYSDDEVGRAAANGMRGGN